MTINFTFGLVAISEGNDILVLLAQTTTFIYISLYIWASEDTFPV